MNARVSNAVNGRLSLRAPQSESLARLIRAIEAAADLLTHDRDVADVLARLQKEFPSLRDFEREFPSLCFALATGVGKTRLMGAFIAYLHLAHGINNFFVLAPNLTVYNKLIADFTRNTPKYVFKGIAEFAQQPPLIITGDNYDQTGVAVDPAPQGFAHDVRINIFNISKINSEVRGGKEPRIKRMKEVLGDSYFNHLASLPDLVMLMDESHRYRASAGVRSINELRPLFGLELTATPFVEAGSGRTVQFQNIIMDYPLARAMEDGFVKEPAVVTQRNFDAKAHSQEEIEKIKLEDGVRIHETTKVELLTYARENEVASVKPLMLVIARDTSHAGSLYSLLQSDAFYGGRYNGRVIQVDSSRTGADEEAMVSRLLAVESVDEPTEIVIHVNMLKEGWDVTNLYTIVPLRAANARTLIEQSIGRGLRLPYGKRTGVAVVDRLNIIAHDKFQEIIDDANRPDSPIRLKEVILEAPTSEDNKISVQVSPTVWSQLGISLDGDMSASVNASEPNSLFKTDAERGAAKLVIEVIGMFELQREEVPTSSALLTEKVQQAIFVAVSERMKPTQGDLDLVPTELDLASIIATTTRIVVQQTIDIPRISLVPTGETSSGFRPFQLDVGQLHLQPGDREIVGQLLRTSEQFTLKSSAGLSEVRLEDYIVHALIDFDDIDYFTQSELIYDLAGQMVKHLLTYLSDEDSRKVLDRDRRIIAREIRSQMMEHFWEESTSYEIKVSRGFTQLKQSHFTTTAGQSVCNIRDTVLEPSRIKQMIFGGFSRCLYPLQKFDSDTERRFAVLLERDALKWFRPAKGQFQIYYKFGSEQPEYIPDFVAELDDSVWIVETKSRADLADLEVRAKSLAASQWCKHASEHASKIGSKKWKYLLIPHDEISESNRLKDYLRFEVRD